MNTAKRNWETTIMGILMLAMAGVGIWQDPVNKASDPQTIAMIGGAVGLIVAKDDKEAPALDDPR